jgi:serine/threonine protein phosphatase PrpC
VKGQGYPGLAMARSIGDRTGESVGVICEPILTEARLTGGEQFLVACSDGIWDVMNNEDVVNFVQCARAE